MKRLIDKYPILVVIVFMFVALSPMMALRDFTPSNELRYLSIADEALSNGNIFAFTNQGEHYADKPPLYFWIIMLFKLILGEHSMFALSLFSLIPAFVIIAVMDKWMRKAMPGRFSGEERAGSALLLASSGLFLGMSVFLRMDMLMCMWIVLAIWTFWKLDNGVGKEAVQKWLLPIYIFMALFTKGPVGILLPPAAIAVYLIAEKRPKDILKYLGLRTWGVIALLCFFWFTGVWFDGGKEYLNNLLFHQTMGRAVNSFHHKAPFYQYAITIWEVMAPWCLATVPVIVTSLLKKGKGEEAEAPSSAERLFSLTAITCFVMLSCFSSKLAIYLAPIFAFAAYLFPMNVKRRGWKGWYRIAITIPAVILLIIGIVVCTVSFFCLIMNDVPEMISYPFLKSPLIFIGGLMVVIACLKALRQLRKYTGQWQKPVISIAAGMLLCIFAVSFKMPQINDYVGYGNMCKLIPAEGEVYTMAVHRPENIDVYIGRDIYDFGKDVESFKMIAPKKGTFIISTSFLGKNEYMMDYLEGQEFEFCGNYAVYKLNKVAKAEVKANAKEEKAAKKEARKAARKERKENKE